MSMRQVRIQQEFAYNRIIMFRSLDDCDLDTAGSLHELLPQYYRGSATSFTLIDVSSTVQLEQELLAILIACRVHGQRPILHFEMHGDSNEGLKLFPSRQYFCWARLIACLRAINHALDGQLLVVMAACSALECIREVSINERAPFCALIAPDTTITAAQVEVSFREFYRRLSADGDLTHAVQGMTEHIKQYIAEVEFLRAFAKYTVEHCIGANRQERVERLLDVAMTDDLIRQRLGITMTRRIFKKTTKPQATQFERFRKVFLGDASTLTFDQLMDHLGLAERISPSL